MSDQEVKDELPKLNELHPPGRNGKALDVTSAILFLGGCAGESDNLYGIARRRWCDRGSACGLVNATVQDCCIASDPVNSWLMAPFGASCVLLFSAPGSPLSQPASVIVGHIVSTGIGLALRVLLLMEWRSMGLAIAIAAMAALRVTHPPAGADPLVLVLDNPEWGISDCPSRLEV